jgi:hypothetical protein
MSTFIPGGMLIMERVSPSYIAAGQSGFPSIMRLSGALGLASGFFLFYSRSINRFYGFTENRREVEMDMREMTDRVKRGEPLYGVSTMTEYMQGVASRYVLTGERREEMAVGVLSLSCGSAFSTDGLTNPPGASEESQKGQRLIRNAGNHDTPASSSTSCPGSTSSTIPTTASTPPSTTATPSASWKRSAWPARRLHERILGISGVRGKRGSEGEACTSALCMKRKTPPPSKDFLYL